MKRPYKRCPHENPVRKGSGNCVECTKEREREYYKNVYREKKLAYMKAHAAENLDRSRAWLKADREKHPEKYRRYNREYRQLHGDELRAQAREWSKNNRARANSNERARRLNFRDQIGITQREWDAIVAKQCGKCAECGKKRKLTQDHIDPVSKGGAHGPHNIRGLCGTCNSSKGNRIIPGTQMGLILRRAA